MDMDQVITNNFNDILNYNVNDGELLTYNAWWDNKLKKNGGFYKFKSGTLNHVWDDFETLNLNIGNHIIITMVLFIKNIMVNKTMFMIK